MGYVELWNQILCGFTKYTTQKLVAKPHSMWMNCYELHFVHLILKAKNLMRKTAGNVFSSFKGSRRIFVNHITIFNSSAMEHLRWSYLWQKTGKGWNLCWLLLCCYIFKISNSPPSPQKNKNKKKQKKHQNKHIHVSSIFTVNNKDTRTTCGTSIVNFKHIFHFILLLSLLNSNKYWLSLKNYSFRQ